MFRKNQLLRLFLVVITLWSAAPVAADSQGRGPKQRTYVVLGDSLAFGYSTEGTTFPSYGDQGYVKPYADWLGSEYGGRRPRVINLAVPGETTSSIFAGGMLGEFLNLNYTNPPLQSQAGLLLEHLAAEEAAGHVVKTITIQIGANDVLGLITPEFFALPPAEQQQLLLQTLNQVTANYARLLTLVRAAAPHARVVLVGYHNPIAPDPANPLYPVAAAAVQGLNRVVEQMAGKFHVRHVDVYEAFVGLEAELTYMGVLPYPHGIHPTPTGYAVIAEHLIAASQDDEEPASKSVQRPGTARSRGLAVARPR